MCVTEVIARERSGRDSKRSGRWVRLPVRERERERRAVCGNANVFPALAPPAGLGAVFYASGSPASQVPPGDVQYVSLRIYFFFSSPLILLNRWKLRQFSEISEAFREDLRLISTITYTYLPLHVPYKCWYTFRKKVQIRKPQPYNGERSDSTYSSQVVPCRVRFNFSVTVYSIVHDSYVKSLHCGNTHRFLQSSVY